VIPISVWEIGRRQILPPTRSLQTIFFVLLRPTHLRPVGSPRLIAAANYLAAAARELAECWRRNRIDPRLHC
jgi:hypothetical protein